jgi:hypothetical protein
MTGGCHDLSHFCQLDGMLSFQLLNNFFHPDEAADSHSRLLIVSG